MASLAKTLGKTLAKTLGYLLVLGSTATASASNSTLTNSSFAGAADETPRTLTYTGVDTNGDPLPAGHTVTFSVDTTAMVDAAASLVTVNPAEIADDGVESATITSRLIDTDADNVVGWSAAALVLASTGTGNVITQPVAVSNILGIQTGSMTSTVAEAKTLSATAGGLAITDTAALTASGAPAVDSFTNEPGSVTLLSEWNNEAALTSESFYMDGNPNPTTGANHARVTSGYGSAPPFGGTAVAECTYPLGAIGGYGAGRWSYNVAPSTTREVYLAWLHKLDAAYFVGSSNKMMEIIYGVTRCFIGFQTNGMWSFSFGSSEWGADTNTRIESTESVNVGNWQKVEWYMKGETSVGAGDGILRLWVDGTLAIERTNLTTPDRDITEVYEEGTLNLGSPLSAEQKRWVAVFRVSAAI